MARDRGPFTDSHERSCKEQLKALAALDQMIERCERAKMDCSEMRAQKQQLQERLAAIDQEFFCDGTPAQRARR